MIDICLALHWVSDLLLFSIAAVLKCKTRVHCYGCCMFFSCLRQGFHKRFIPIKSIQLWTATRTPSILQAELQWFAILRYQVLWQTDQKLSERKSPSDLQISVGSQSKRKHSSSGSYTISLGAFHKKAKVVTMQVQSCSGKRYIFLRLWSCFDFFTPPPYGVLDRNTVERTEPKQSPKHREVPAGLSLPRYRCVRAKEVHQAKRDGMFPTHRPGAWRNGDSPGWMCVSTQMCCCTKPHKPGRGEGCSFLFPVNLCLPSKKSHPYVIAPPSRASEMQYISVNEHSFQHTLIVFKLKKLSRAGGLWDVPACTKPASLLPSLWRAMASTAAPSPTSKPHPCHWEIRRSLLRQKHRSSLAVLGADAEWNWKCFSFPRKHGVKLRIAACLPI